VRSCGPLYSVGKKVFWHQQNSKAKAGKALGSTCIGTWASRSHSSCYRHRGPKATGSRNPGSCLLVLGYHGRCCRHGENKPLAVGFMGPTLQVWAPGGRYSSAADTGEPSLQAVGIPEQFSGAAASMGNQAYWLVPCYPWNSRSHGSCLHRDTCFPGISG
jgi:hypothetical protein